MPFPFPFTPLCAVATFLPGLLPFQPPPTLLPPLLLLCFGASHHGAPLSLLLCLFLLARAHSAPLAASIAAPLLRGAWLALRPGGAARDGAWLRWELALCAGALLLLARGGGSGGGGATAAASVDASRLPAEVGLHAPLFASAFPRALPYFTALGWAFPLACTAPLAARLWGAPIAAGVAAAGVAAALDPTAGGGALPGALPLLCALGAGCPDGGDPARRMAPRRALLWGALAVFSLWAAPLMKGAWLRSGGVGNANFLLNMQLVAPLAVGALATEFAAAAAKGDDGGGDVSARAS